MPSNVTIDMVKNLSRHGRQFIDSFVKKLERDETLLEKTCSLIVSKTNNPALINDMKNLSGEGKHQACVEYMIIGLVSGNIKVEELAQMVQEYNAHQGLIKDK